MSGRLADLVEPNELCLYLGRSDVVLIDARDSVDYERGHLPGAQSLDDIFYYICLPENGGLPAMREHFARRFGELGVRAEDHVVVYEDAQDNGYGKSCRGWMLLKYLGHANASVLHGGFRAWKAAGLPVETAVMKRPVAEFIAQETPGHILGLEDVLREMRREDTVLVDCRDYAEWLGANSSPYGYDYCPRKGRIPGARWLEWYRLIERHGGVAWIRPPAEVRELCAEIDLNPDQQVIVYCFKGARASVVVMALRQAGFTRVGNYFSAWNEWSRDLSLPVDEGYPETV